MSTPTPFEKMIASIDFFGVDPAKYKKFVDYIVTAETPADNTIAIAYEGTFSSIVNGIYFFVIFLLFLLIVIVVFIIMYLRYINWEIALGVIVLSLVFLVVFWAINATFLKESLAILARDFEKETSDLTLYSFNSIFRDFIYSALLR